MEPPDWLNDPDTLIVGVGSGMYPERQAILVRVSADAAQDLVGALQAEGMDVGLVPMNTALPWDQFAQIAVLTGGSLVGLARVLEAFFNRHQHRSVKFLHQGESVEVAGMSKEDMRETITSILRETQARQEKNDELWDKLVASEEKSDEEPQ